MRNDVEAIFPQTIAQDDPFYTLAELADKGGKSLNNEEMDRIVYDA